jgi:RNA polymerase sigma factor (sigma-70 family)
MLVDEIQAQSSPQEMKTLLDEALEPIFKAIDDTDLQQIVRQRLEGESTQEIADRLGLTQRTVQRRLEAIRGKLVRLKPNWEG